MEECLYARSCLVGVESQIVMRVGYLDDWGGRRDVFDEPDVMGASSDPIVSFKT